MQAEARKPAPIMRRMFLLIVIWFVIHLGVLLYYGLVDDIRPADAAIVYGSHVHQDGSPSHWLRERLDRAIELYRLGLFPRIIVSGGIDGPGRNEALVMGAYLRSKGIPGNAIIEDSTGFSTYDTALNVKKLSSSSGMKSFLVVSQYYHILRIELSLRKAHVGVVHHAHAKFAPTEYDLYAVPREIAAFYYYIIWK